MPNSPANEAERFSADLGAVQETLLIPLYFRAMETERDDAIIRDPKAVEIVDSIDYDFAKFAGAWNLQMDVAVRTEIFDERVREFIVRHPDAAIINLGAGLDGRFERIDNGRIRWWDLDLPDSIELRERFYRPSDRNAFIASDCFDTAWMDNLDLGPDRPLLVTAEGLFCYCDELKVRSLFAELSQRWPGAEILFQSICPAIVGKQSTVAAVCKTDAVFRWGICDGQEVCGWDPCYQYIGEWYLVDRHRRRWKSIRYRTWFPPTRAWFRQVMKITQVRLG
ncbi:Leucine carboxyl methyltransferase [Planctomycetes bacterium CA13]|uniref:Leucine carboxyl methyltransferase n=1 Tax=Novipirellula herctigrandis TaxID=2527986 RepID=A0A5C5YWM6_9BACT|nr:Leucine carboxyl methyltransferase [Planctomycetes bacterium CA13]